MHAGKGFLQFLLRSCVTSYFDPRTHKLNPDAYNGNGSLKKEYEGSVEDYLPYDSHEWFYGGNDCGFTWARTLYGQKTFGVTLRGTYNTIGWALNFVAEKNYVMDYEPWGSVTATGIAVHAGFHFGVKSIFDIVLSRARDALDRGAVRIIVTGHSRGAAIAQGVAVGLQKILSEQEKRKFLLCARLFASPRYFNRAGVVSYNRRVPDTIRIRYRNDPVCGVPPDWMGYDERVGDEIRLDYTWIDAISPCSWAACVPVVGTALSAIAAADHYPMRYLAGLRRI
jgi:hypothetical protein